MRSTFYLRFSTDMALSNSRPSHPRLGRVTRRWLAGPSVCVGLVLGANPALAEPAGHEVLNGHAEVTYGAHTLIETTSRRTRLRWESFDIAIDESVHAEQPSAGSILVNQVDDASLTRIDGILTSNGKNTSVGLIILAEPKVIACRPMVRSPLSS